MAKFKLFQLCLLAFITNLITILMYRYQINLPGGGSGSSMEFSLIWMPAIWIVCVIFTIVLSILNRRFLFYGAILKWTFIVVIFCTPLPMLFFYILTHPAGETQINSSGFDSKNGKIYKSEEWVYSSNRKYYVHKYFIADSTKEAEIGEGAFARDSIWVYLSKLGDTIKIESYKNGRTLSIKQSNKNIK